MNYTPEPMTLEQVRDMMRAYNPDADEYLGKYIHKQWADAIDAELSKRRQAEPIGFINEADALLLAAQKREGDAWQPIDTLEEDIDFFASEIGSFTRTYLNIGGGYRFNGQCRAFNAFGESFTPTHWMQVPLPPSPDQDSEVSP